MIIDMLPKTMRGNIYNDILVDELGKLGCTVRDHRLLTLHRPDILHIQWFEVPFLGFPARRSRRASAVLARAQRYRIRQIKAAGGRLVWTAHNLQPHDDFIRQHTEAWRIWREDVAPVIDAVFCMSPSSIEEVRLEWPELGAASFRVIPHPHYANHYARFRSREEQRRLLGLPQDAVVIGAIGAIRQYKGLPELIRLCKPHLGEKQFLIIAGHCWDPALALSIKAEIDDHPRIVLLNARLDDFEFASMVKALDWSIFNYRAVLNSGSAVASLSLGVPVIAPAIGGLTNLEAIVGGGWLSLFDGDAEELVTSALQGKLPFPSDTPDLSSFEPIHVAALHLAAYTELVEQRVPH